MTNRRLGLGVPLALGAVLLTIGGILLDIVGDPIRSDPAFQLGAGVVILGAVSILVALETAWLRKTARLSWKDVLSGVVVAALLVVGAGLLVQLFYEDPRAFPLLLAVTAIYLVVLTAGYAGLRFLLHRLELPSRASL